MTNFFNEICESVGLEPSTIRGQFKLVSLGFDSIYIEGHKGLSVFSSTEMSFKVKGGSVKILGEKLELKNFSKLSALVKGKINKVDYCFNEKV